MRDYVIVTEEHGALLVKARTVGEARDSVDGTIVKATALPRLVPWPRRRYRFTGRGGDRYYWESVSTLTNDSRVEQQSCPVDWFWRAGR